MTAERVLDKTNSPLSTNCFCTISGKRIDYYNLIRYFLQRLNASANIPFFIVGNNNRADFGHAKI